MEKLKLGDVVYLYNNGNACKPFINGEYLITDIASQHSEICRVINTENSKHVMTKGSYNFSIKNLRTSIYELNYAHCDLINNICKNLDILSRKIK